MSHVKDCVKLINKSVADFKPSVGLILGSGLGQFCDNVETIASIDFNSLPGFPDAGVGGHAGRLIFGSVAGGLTWKRYAYNRSYQYDRSFTLIWG